jgi:tryptophan synthase alpha subunit
MLGATKLQRNMGRKRIRRLKTITLAAVAVAFAAAAERKRQAEAGIKTIDLPPAEAKKWSDTAKSAGWAAVMKTSPETGAKLKELLTKK